MALKSLEVVDLDVLCYKISNVGLQLLTRVAVLFRKGIAVRSKRRFIPFLVQHLWKGFKGIGELPWTISNLNKQCTDTRLEQRNGSRDKVGEKQRLAEVQDAEGCMHPKPSA